MRRRGVEQAAGAGAPADPAGRRLLAERPAVRLRVASDRDMPADVVGGAPGAHLDVRVEAGTIPVGAHVEVSYTRWDDASYRFATAVAAVGDHDVRELRLAWPVRIEREQHRRHVRTPVAAAATLAVARPQALSGAGRRRVGLGPGWHDADVVDVSGGGAAVVGATGLDPGDVVLLRAEVPGRVEPVVLDVRARVARVEPTRRRDGTAGELCAYGLQFLDLTAAAEDQVVATVLWRKAASRPAAE